MIAIITGASRGIGCAIAKKFLSEGYTVLGGARSGYRLRDAAARFKSEGFDQFHYKSADLSTSEGVRMFADWCNTFGTPHILINNAGTFTPGDCISETEGALEQMINTNLYSAYRLTRLLLPGMIAAKKGHIFNMCSIAGLKAYPGGGSYSISKYALRGFTDNLRYELRNHLIKVTGVYPGAVMTDSWEGFDNSTGRILTVDDIAEMVFSAARLSPQACVEEIVIRPQLGDL